MHQGKSIMKNNKECISKTRVARLTYLLTRI